MAACTFYQNAMRVLLNTYRWKNIGRSIDNGRNFNTSEKIPAMHPGKMYMPPSFLLWSITTIELYIITINDYDPSIYIYIVTCIFSYTAILELSDFIYYRSVPIRIFSLSVWLTNKILRRSLTRTKLQSKNK